MNNIWMFIKKADIIRRFVEKMKLVINYKLIHELTER
jgi:hypothetical protein